jgi:sec-independent protein translocase protein TatB
MREREAAQPRVAPRLADVFNVQGSELIFLLLVALVVLGPEKLPEAVRKFTKAYAEFKKMANGFQGEFRQVLDEPMRELRETANAVRDATKFDFDLDPEPKSKSAGRPTPAADATDAAAQVDPAAAVSEIKPKAPPAGNRTASLNFGSANPRRQARIPRDDTVATATPAGPAAIPADATATPADATATPADAPAVPADTPAAPMAEDATE